METDIFKLSLLPDSDVLLQTQVYVQLRDLILRGELLPGVRLPPSRKLAEVVGVSRKTIVAAYDQLLAEGYVTSQIGSGTYVSDPSSGTRSTVADANLKNPSSGSQSTEGDTNQPDQTSVNVPLNREPQKPSTHAGQSRRITDIGTEERRPSGAFDAASLKSPATDVRQTGITQAKVSNEPGRLLGPERRANEPARAIPTPSSNREALSLYARRLATTEPRNLRLEQMRFPFFNWQPAFDEIPLTDWARLISKTFRRLEPELLDYASDPLGHMPLREAIAERLLRTRGLSCQPEQIIVNCGLSQSLDLIARMHAEDGMELLVENPSYRPIRDVFRTYGAQVRSIDVDQGGMKTERLAKLSKHNVRAIYVTPSHQFPTGAVLSLSRRLELIKWATESGAMIIEDDFDSEFRYRGTPIPAMKTLDKEEQVIYLSSFTKVFYPSLAIAFMVIPQRLISVYAKARWLACDQASIQVQEALAEFISTGQLERHVKRMRTIYAHRRKALLEAVQDHLPGCATTHGDQAGLSTLIRIKCNLEDEEIIERANARGIAMTSTRSCYTRNAVRGEFILGYGNMNENQIRQGIIELRMIVTGR
jgi:GntR family transcriptional regulator/MocR family aminotransferase